MNVTAHRSQCISCAPSHAVPTCTVSLSQVLVSGQANSTHPCLAFALTPRHRSKHNNTQNPPITSRHTQGSNQLIISDDMCHRINNNHARDIVERKEEREREGKEERQRPFLNTKYADYVLAYLKYGLPRTRVRTCNWNSTGLDDVTTSALFTVPHVGIYY